MVEEFSEFKELLELARQGSEPALRHLIEHYGRQLRRVVRRRISTQLRRRLESEDFVQIVWASFFRQPDRLANIEDPYQFQNLLMGMLQTKIASAYYRNYSMQKRDIRREESLEQRQAMGEDKAVVSDAATPSEIAVAVESYGEMIRQGSADEQAILRGRLHGISVREIRESLGLTSRAFRRKLGAIAARIRRSED
ncbi:MAG: ECF-type sigma factor [Pirellulaceae bacterium]|nr:hypothetical protein [Planctomycetales bacterium]